MGRKSRILWYIPVLIIGPIGFVLSSIGIGMVLLSDRFIDNARLKDEDFKRY